MSKGRIKIGIFAYSLLAMGAIGLNSVLSDMADYFHVSDTTIALIASIPCIVIIVVTLFLGKVLEHISQKRVGIFGALCFLVGGLLPLVLDNLILIFICRAVTGIGIAISQVFMASLNAEFFEEEERPPVQGLASAAQTAGMIIMCLCSGFLATISWRACFLVHLVGLLGLLAMIFCIPDRKPAKKQPEEHKEKSHLNIRTFGWFLLMFFIFLIILIYANNLSFLLVEKGIGTAADTGLALSVYAFGGLLTGLIYGKIDRFLGTWKLPLSMFLLAAMFFITTLAQSMPVIYIGGFIGGVGLSLFFPQIILYTGLSVEPAVIPVAVSLLTCFQNLGQILCPYAINPLATMLSNESNVQQIKMYIGMAAFLILAVILLFYSVRRTRRERAV
ncbi:MAG: MFS transporter [Lachnospiraceae bacterium]|nr:MFS transporter [Lachnospiraceae bacterium]